MYQISLIFFSWIHSVKLKISTQSTHKGNRVVWIAGDADYLIGSKSDEDILMAGIGGISKPHRTYRFSQTLGINSMHIWGRVWIPFRFALHASKINPPKDLIMGVAVMDDYYSPVTSLRIISILEAPERLQMTGIINTGLQHD